MPIDVSTRYRSDVKPPKPRAPRGLPWHTHTTGTRRATAAIPIAAKAVDPDEARHIYAAAVAFLADTLGAETEHAVGVDWGSVVRSRVVAASLRIPSTLDSEERSELRRAVVDEWLSAQGVARVTSPPTSHPPPPRCAASGPYTCAAQGSQARREGPVGLPRPDRGRRVVSPGNLDNRGALDREYDPTRREEAKRRREDDRWRDDILGVLLRQDRRPKPEAEAVEPGE